MKNWQHDLINSLFSIDCEHKLFEKLVMLAQSLDFDFCAYGLRAPLPVSNPKTAMFNNYPSDWRAIYRENNYVDVDPTVQHGIRSLLPILWSENVFSSAPDLWEEAKSFGLRYGWAQSCRCASGAGGMLTLSRSHDALSANELRDKGTKMAWLAQVAHLTMSKCMLPKLVPEVQVKLSAREVEILRWTADGKTSGEISEILNISERTVNFHINNAITKMNTSNKTAAVVRAAMLGILY